jgi:transposase
MYDFDKENDKDFLKEAGKLLQQKVLDLELKLSLALKLSEKDQEILQKLTEELKILRERVFNSKQEKKANGPRNKKRKKGKLPHNKSKNAAIEDQEIDLQEDITQYPLEDESICPKCGGDKIRPMKGCFEESSEIEVTDRTYVIKRHQRQKYSCGCCNNIVTAPGGTKLTPGGEYSIQMATQVACDKFEDHIPLERQRKQMKRSGVNVEVKTLYGLTEHLYHRLYPLLDMIKIDILENEWIHIDESPITFYNPNKDRGYIWSMSNNIAAYYQFEPTRSGLIAQEMLKNYKSGCVVTDGFSGYGFLDKKDGVGHAFCWAHVRRKFFDAMKDHPEAEKMVDWIDELYEIEHQADELKDLGPLRSEQSSKVVKNIDKWIESMDGHYLDSLTIGKAINYYLERKQGLHLFLHDINVPIDNNMAERRQRCPVMGRKNFLHFKSINGADVGALFYSIVESCRTNGLDARAYINEMAHRSANGEELETPYRYSKRLNIELTARLAGQLQELSKQSDSS